MKRPNLTDLSIEATYMVNDCDSFPWEKKTYGEMLELIEYITYLEAQINAQ